METSDAHGNLFYSKGDRLHMCFTRWQAYWEALLGKDDDVADHSFESHNPVYQIMSVIMESIRPYSSDCREKGNARKDCSKLSAWLVGCKRRKLERASDTGKLNCAPNRLGGQGSATTGGEEALRKLTAIDSGLSPRLYRGRQEQGNEWQPSNAWRFNFRDRLSPPTLVSATLEAKDFIAQCMGCIIGMMAADDKNDWSPSPCNVRRLVSPSGRLHNEDGLSNGSDFSTFGKDETTKLPENTMRERWETHI